MQAGLLLGIPPSTGTLSIEDLLSRLVLDAQRTAIHWLNLDGWSRGAATSSRPFCISGRLRLRSQRPNRSLLCFVCLREITVLVHLSVDVPEEVQERIRGHQQPA